MSKAVRFLLLLSLLVIRPQMLCAQFDFVYKGLSSGIEADDGRKYIEIEIRDSTLSKDSYISTLYSVLAETYQDANIQIVGNKIIRMDATSLGLDYTEKLKLYVDFSIMFEIKDRYEMKWKDSIYYWNRPSIRISSPVIKKLTAYNPYYKPDIKVYATEKIKIHNTLMEKPPYSMRETIMEDFLISEIGSYILSNIKAVFLYKDDPRLGKIKYRNGI